ncbi:DUF6233 domain-containing protein [Streptomyces sp. NPDC001698]|uniref:DUF6233 domain-containing protein n=1 Tax=unclassified Streptomyces TaxID=2593676 RepID=UPI003699318C
MCRWLVRCVAVVGTGLNVGHGGCAVLGSTAHRYSCCGDCGRSGGHRPHATTARAFRSSRALARAVTWIARERHREAERRRGERPSTPPIPPWTVELGIGQGRPPTIVHVGGCHMAGTRQRPSPASKHSGSPPRRGGLRPLRDPATAREEESVSRP